MVRVFICQRMRKTKQGQWIHLLFEIILKSGSYLCYINVLNNIEKHTPTEFENMLNEN